MWKSEHIKIFHLSFGCHANKFLQPTHDALVSQLKMLSAHDTVHRRETFFPNNIQRGKGNEIIENTFSKKSEFMCVREREKII